MKKNQAAKIALLLVLALATGYWLGFQDGKSSKTKQTRVSFRQAHNDVATPFPTQLDD